MHKAGGMDLFLNAKKSGDRHKGGRTKDVIARAYAFALWFCSLNTTSHVRYSFGKRSI